MNLKEVSAKELVDELGKRIAALEKQAQPKRFIPEDSDCKLLNSGKGIYNPIKD